MGVRAGVLGASGYAGGELVRLLDGHPELDLVHLGAHSSEGARLGDVHPQLGGRERRLGSNLAGDLPDLDIAFLALPHGASADIGRDLARRGVKVVDLGSDYRLDSDVRYQAAYGAPHPFPGELADWLYGLPEHFDLAGADRVASPGCYPTATLLAAVPLLAAGLVGNGPLVADCLSGVSGAGRAVREDLTFGAVAEGVRAYGVGAHRHRPEIEMGIELATSSPRSVVFTPHLVPIQRGLLATVTLPAADGISQEQVRDALDRAYRGCPFVDVIDRPPQTRWVAGSNRALVTAVLDEPAGSVIALCAIDNLVKGAAGQAVQAANLMLGFDEASGLPVTGWMP